MPRQQQQQAQRQQAPAQSAMIPPRGDGKADSTDAAPPRSHTGTGPVVSRSIPGHPRGAAREGVFLLNEFPSGQVRGCHADAAGATYRMTGARILNDGVMGIGMAWHPDGSLMMVDWMGGYPLDGLGALWRVDAREDVRPPLRPRTAGL